MNRKFLLIGGIGIVAVLLVVLIFSKRGTSNLSQNLQSGQKIIPKSATPTSQSTPQAAVPLPRGEDIVRTFFNLIGEGRIGE
jgi:Na+-transporting methylmalonyl-CoA/oxaloacetate decarboxylase gamma subunit